MKNKNYNFFSKDNIDIKNNLNKMRNIAEI